MILELSSDGSLFPLGSTATNKPIEIPRSLWRRWKSPDAAGSKPCGSRGKATQNKRKSTLNDHRGTSGYPFLAVNFSTIFIGAS
ncbi:MAG: hypothetical protein RQ885_12830 [Desulfurococcales archaeon]|nr:hypothetical protein [Desulfurococcales archaeon]